MFNLVDEIFRSYLERAAGDAIDKAGISFELPDSASSKTGRGINCYLYDVSENDDMRSNEWSVSRNTDGTAMMSRAPFWLSCEYLVTARAENIEEEHRLLGKLFTSLLAVELNAKSALAKKPEKINNENVLLRFNKNSQSRIAEIWRGSGLKPKLSLSYTLVCSIDKQEPENVQLVKERIFNMELKKEIVAE